MPQIHTKEMNQYVKHYQQTLTNDNIDVVIVIPADGPSFGVAPSGTCICISISSKKDDVGSMSAKRARATVYYEIKNEVSECRRFASAANETPIHGFQTYRNFGALLHDTAQLSC